MLSASELSAANVYGETLRRIVHERELPATARVRAAGGCLMIAQDLHHAIIVLIEARLYAGAFALVRVAFEAYVRGEWLSLCATDAQVGQFLSGGEPPGINGLLAALGQTPGFQEEALSQIKSKSWGTMCGYTHVGGLHVQRWITGDGIESNYARDEILEALQFADVIVSLSVLGVLALASDDVAAEKVLEAYRQRMA